MSQIRSHFDKPVSVSAQDFAHSEVASVRAGGRETAHMKHE